MKTLLITFLLISFTINAQNGVNTPLMAFFTADGPGKVAIGGRGRDLAIITSLDEKVALSGPFTNAQGETYWTGGLWDAMQNDAVGHIVFNVSGVIELTRGTASGGSTTGTIKDFSTPLDGSIAGMYGVHHKSIYGQSAPRGGITFRGGNLRITGKYDPVDCDNLILRYFRSRPMYDRYGDINLNDDAHTSALKLQGDSVIVDHFSGSWAQDKVVSTATNDTEINTVTKHTYQHMLVGEGNTNCYVEVNPNQTGDPEKKINYIAYLRNVIFAGNRTPNFAYDGVGEIKYNIIYNANFKYTRSYHDMLLNHMNNYYYETSGFLEFNWIGDMDASIPRIHSSGNYAIGTVERSGFSVAVNFDGTLGQLTRELWTSDVGQTLGVIGNTHWSATEHTVPWTTVEWTALQAWNELIEEGDVGAYKYLDDNGEVQIYRDSYDTEVLTNIKNKTADPDWRNGATFLSRFPVLPTNVRPGSYDTDFDGMADAWEIREYGNLNQGYSGDFDGDGYENIEEYMNQVDGVIGSGPPPPPGPGPSVPNKLINETSGMLITH